MSNTENYVLLARVFALCLHMHLGRLLLREADGFNDLELAGSKICHTHDHCDANVFLNRAFRTLFGRDMNVQSDSDTELCNCAWRYAKGVGFCNIIDWINSEDT